MATQAELQTKQDAIFAQIDAILRNRWSNKEQEKQKLEELRATYDWLEEKIKNLDGNANGDLTVRSGVPIDS